MTQFDKEKEVNEAIIAANDALFHLNNSLEILNKASTWGMIDILGGGFFTTMIKRNRMSEAKEEMVESQRALDRLNRELGDLGEHLELDFSEDGFLEFADYFFDNPITDIMTQSKITRAKQMVQDAMDDVEAVLDELETEL